MTRRMSMNSLLDESARARLLLRWLTDQHGFRLQRATAPKWITHGPKSECWTNAYENLIAAPDPTRFSYCEGYVIGAGIDPDDEGRAHAFLVDRRKPAAIECTVSDAWTRWGHDVEFRGLPLRTAAVVDLQSQHRAIAEADPDDHEPRWVMGLIETVMGLQLPEAETNAALNRIIDPEALEYLT